MRRLLPPLVSVALVVLSPGIAEAGWRSAPVLPKLDDRGVRNLVATATTGRRLGNRADVFAKVGDSISGSPAFVQGMGCGRWYGLRSDLRPALRFFSARRLDGTSSDCDVVNSFSRNSAATRAFMPSGWALLPGGSVDPACGEDETPLSCEIRVIRPAYAVILFGTNDVNFGQIIDVDPLDGFLANMGQIVRTARRSGTVPVLSTVPPRTDDPAAEGMSEELNAGLYRLTVQHHVPLINLWRAFTRLPNWGLSRDGEHPSLYGGPDCVGLCDPNRCDPACQAGNLASSGLLYGHNLRNLLTLAALSRLSKLAFPRGAMKDSRG